MKRIMFTAFAVGLGLTVNVWGQIIINEQFNDASSLNNWIQTSIGNGGSANITGGFLNLNTNGGSNGYSGLPDALDLKASYAEMPTDLINKTIEFNINELNRFSNNLDNEWVDFSAILGIENNNGLHILIRGNWDKNDYQGAPFQSHRIDVIQFISGSQTLLHSTNLNIDQLYNIDVKFRNNNGLWIVEFVVNGVNIVVNSNFSLTFNVPFKYRISSGDGGYTFANGGGSFSSDYFKVSENCSHDLTISPSINTQSIGSYASFVATTSDPSATYVWQSDLGQGFQTLNNYGNYSGVNTNSLTISNVQLANHNQPIRAISTLGNCIDTSNIATIQIADTCITNVTVYDTLLTAVTDTLIINTTLSLPAPNNENTILIYPNPASDHITIDNGNFAAMAGYSIKIENNAGQLVFQSAINQAQFYVDLSTWTGNGLYFVHLIDSQNNTVTVRKIVLQ